MKRFTMSSPMVVSISASKDSITQTLLINHGRTSNRLKDHEAHLALIKEVGLIRSTISLSLT
jgi:hypothetical protein